MPLIQVSGFPAGPPTIITHPLNGRPWADVVLGVTAVPWAAGDQVKIKIDTDPAPPEYLMTVERVGQRGGFVSARLVGGTGGLSKDIAAKWYKNIPAETVVREILTECGEVVGEINLPSTLPKWLRPAGPAHEALQAVMMRYPERIWWMDAEGKVQVDVPHWKPLDTELPLERYDVAQGLYVVGFTPVLTANRHVTMTRGTERVAKRATRVIHSVAEVYDYPKPRTELRTLIQVGDGQDVGPRGLEFVTQQATRWTDYCALYPCEVLRDHGNHTLDLRTEHPLMPDLTEVRLLQPIAGAKVKLKAGAKVLLEFQAGDPARPVVTGYAAASIEKFELVTGRGQGIVIDDDRGQKSPDDHEYQRPHIKMMDAAGQLCELWAESGQERIRLRDKVGQEVKLDAAAGSASMKGLGGLLEILKGGDVNLKANGNLNLSADGEARVEAAHIKLGGNTPVARVGDPVSTPAGPGTIVGGSSKVGSG